MPPAGLAQCFKHTFDHIDVTSTFTVSGAPPVLESRGNAPSDDLFRAAGAAAGAQSRPAGDVRGPVEYKRAMAAELTLRALRRATERAIASA